MAQAMFNCILLIDDDKVTNHLHTIIIKDTGIAERVEVRNNGRDGLAFLQEAHWNGNVPQLVFVDLKMPVMDGFGFVDAYRQLPVPQNETRIVMLTTSSNPKDVSRMQEMGITEYHEKPLTEEILVSLQRKFELG